MWYKVSGHDLIRILQGFTKEQLDREVYSDGCDCVELAHSVSILDDGVRKGGIVIDRSMKGNK